MQSKIAFEVASNSKLQGSRIIKRKITNGKYKISFTCNRIYSAVKTRRLLYKPEIALKDSLTLKRKS